MSETMTQDVPHLGDEFVWMPAREGQWQEWTEKVERVERDLGDGRFLVGHIKPRLPRVPWVFMEQFGPHFGDAKYARTIIARGPDGRWHAVRDLPAGGAR